MQQLRRRLVARYQECLVPNCAEKGCSLNLDNVQKSSTALISGTCFQKQEDYPDKLCDRIVFHRASGLLLLAVELKGGRDFKLTEALKQIQNGLSVADVILESRRVEGWLPLLVYSGTVTPRETRLLRNRRLSFRGQRKVAVRVDCGTLLETVINAHLAGR